jgi:hypothetical protein
VVPTKRAFRELRSLAIELEVVMARRCPVRC